jgi:hypothetical protein
MVIEIGLLEDLQSGAKSPGYEEDLLKAKELYDKTVRYLCYSKTAYKILNKLSESDKKILVIVKLGEADREGGGVIGSRWDAPNINIPNKMPAASRQKYNGGRVYWWAHDWTLTVRHGWQTPAISLIHELGHAYQRYIMRFGWMMNFGTGGTYDNNATVRRTEDENLKKHENPIAKEIREANKFFYEGWREKYKDTINWHRNVSVPPMQWIMAVYNEMLDALPPLGGSFKNLRAWEVNRGREWVGSMKKGGHLLA